MTLRHALRSLFRRQKLEPQKLLLRGVGRKILDGPEEVIFGPAGRKCYGERPNRERGLRKNSNATCQEKSEETEPVTQIPYSHIWCSRLRILLPNHSECQTTIVTCGSTSLALACPCNA